MVRGGNIEGAISAEPKIGQPHGFGGILSESHLARRQKQTVAVGTRAAARHCLQVNEATRAAEGSHLTLGRLRGLRFQSSNLRSST